MWAVLWVVGCTSTKDGEQTLSGDLVFTDENNYSYDGSLEVESTQVKELTDVFVDWSGLSVDMRGRDVVPSEIDQALLIAFGPTQEEVLDLIVVNDLMMADVQDYRLFTNAEGSTSAWLSQFTVLGNEFDPTTDLRARDDVGAWAIALQDEVDGRTDFLALAFMEPVAETENSEITIGDQTTTLNFDVDLGEALETAEDLQYTLDWSAVTLQASGKAFDPLRADRLFIGHVDMETDAEIEEVFVELMEVADELYRMDVYAETSADLSEATDDAGVAFPGFSAGGSWILGIECTVCTSPAPVLLSRVIVR